MILGLEFINYCKKLTEVLYCMIFNPRSTIEINNWDQFTFGEINQQNSIYQYSYNKFPNMLSLNKKDIR